MMLHKCYAFAFLLLVMQHKLCADACFTAGAGIMYFNLSARTAPRGISVGQDRTVVLSIDGELEKVNYLGVDYQVHTVEVGSDFQSF